MPSLIVSLKTFDDLDRRALPVLKEAGTDEGLDADYEFSEECEEYGVRAYLYDTVEAARSALLTFIQADASYRFWVAETVNSDGSCVHNVIIFETELALPITLWDMRTSPSTDIIVDKETVKVVKPDPNLVKAYLVRAK